MTPAPVTEVGRHPVPERWSDCDRVWISEFSGRAFLESSSGRTEFVRADIADGLLAVCIAYREAARQQDLRLGPINADADAAISRATGGTDAG